VSTGRAPPKMDEVTAGSLDCVVVTVRGAITSFFLSRGGDGLRGSRSSSSCILVAAGAWGLEFRNKIEQCQWMSKMKGLMVDFIYTFKLRTSAVGE